MKLKSLCQKQLILSKLYNTKDSVLNMLAMSKQQRQTLKNSSLSRRKQKEKYWRKHKKGNSDIKTILIAMMDRIIIMIEMIVNMQEVVIILCTAEDGKEK